MTEMTKQAFIERLRIERIKWLALLDEVPPERREEPGVVGQWSVRDLVAHVAVWENWGANVAHSIAEGRAWSREELYGVTIPPEVAALPFDDFNVWLTRQADGRNYVQVTADERAAYWRFVEAFESLNEADLPKPASSFTVLATFTEDTLWDILAAQVYDHYIEHTTSVRAWLDAHATAT